MEKILFIDDEDVAIDTVKDYIPNIETMLYTRSKFDVAGLRAKIKE
jgi:hypothetical protein